MEPRLEAWTSCGTWLRGTLTSIDCSSNMEIKPSTLWSHCPGTHGSSHFGRWSLAVFTKCTCQHAAETPTARSHCTHKHVRMLAHCGENNGYCHANYIQTIVCNVFGNTVVLDTLNPRLNSK